MQLMMKKILSVMILALITVQLNAQMILIYGKAADYATKEISFYTITDPILHQKQELATTKVASDGAFSLLLPVNETTEIYSDLEKFCGTMVVEPGKNYQVALPPFSPRTSAEAHSIYFKPTPYWFGLPGLDNIDLNFAVRSFLTDYNLETIKNTTPIYRQQSKEVANEIIDRLEKKYASIQNPYFTTLKKYTFAELEFAVYQKNEDPVIQKYFANQSIHPGHPAYQRAFELLFTDFLRKQSQDTQNRKITTFINSGDYNSLVAFFETKGFKKEFAGLVVLKGLYESYYTSSFSKEGVLEAIEMMQSETLSRLIQPIAEQVKNKLKLLAVGEKAPILRLYNLKKEMVSIDQFKGKFVYLSFFNSASSDCRVETDSIVSLEKRLRQILTVVSVAVDDDFSHASNLWKTKMYSWELLNGSRQNQLIVNYNASFTPVFYLIGPEGTLLLSQAPSPSHGFEPAFLKLLRDYNFKHKPRQFKPGDLR